MKLELEEPFKSKWRRAYLRTSSDSRRRVDLINSKEDRTTISYARYLVCVHLGYELSKDFEVDHIDNDKTNDSLSNLQALTIEDHRKKTSEECSPRGVSTLVCPNCGVLFARFTNQVAVSQPKCSRRCNAQYNQKQGKWVGKPKSKKLVRISIGNKSFSITVNNICYHINEDDPSIELKKLFQGLGYKVQINEYW